MAGPRRVGGLADINTVLRQRIRALPPTHRDPTLDLFTLSNERRRVQDDLARGNREIARNRRRLKQVLTGMRRAIKGADPDGTGEEEGRARGKHRGRGRAGREPGSPPAGKKWTRLTFDY